MLLFHCLQEAGYNLREGLGINHHIQAKNLNAENLYMNKEKEKKEKQCKNIKKYSDFSSNKLDRFKIKSYVFLLL